MMQVGYRPPMMRMPMQAAQAQMMMQAGVHPQMPPNMPVNMAMPPMGMPNMINTAEMGFDGKMLRKSVARKTVDYNPSVVKYLEDRMWKKDFCDDRSLQADPLYTQQLTLPQHMIDNPVSCIMTKFIRAALNKDPRPVFCVCWTPDGRRLITGASSGEFTLWNGLTFNFETILQAHNSAVRSMIWSHNEQWMLTGDDKGYVKYWQANMNNVKMFQGHFEAIRGLSFSPTDSKFTSCSDDRTVRIFDFVTCTEENVLQGHGSDVKCVDWHPYKGVIISGSKDSQQPIILWDAKNAKKITTIHAHKNTCTDLKWNRFNGNWLVSSSRDHLCKLFDIRNLKEEVQSFRGHKKDACTIAWHPVYEKLFASGGADGSLFFWVVGVEKEVGSMEEAHDGMIWDLSWHPLGHMLVSGSNDRSTRFWTRNRPGDTVVDKTDEISTPKAERSTGIIFKNIELPEPDKQSDGTVNLPGLGLDNEMLDILNEEYRSESPPTTMSPRSTMAPFFPIINYQYLQQQQQEQYQQPGQSQQQLPPHIQQQLQQPPPQLQQAKRDAQQPGAASNEIEDDETRRKKAPYSKPIPKEFEMAWKSNRPMTQPPPPLPPNTLLQLSNPPPPLPPHVANSIQQPMPPIGLMPPGPIPGLMNSGPMPLIHNMPPSSQPLMMPSTNIPPPHHHHHHHHHHQQQQQSQQQQQQANSNQQQPQQNTSNNQSFKNQPFNQQQKPQQPNNNPSSSSNSQNNNNNNNNNQNKSSNIKQSMSSIFDLMAADIEPPNNYKNNNNNKRKLSQDSNVNDSDQDERQWQPKNKQFYNKNNDNLDENAGGDFYNRNYNRRQGARDYSGSQSISSYEENNEGNEDDNDAGEFYNEEQQQQQGSYRNRSASGGGGGSSFRGRPRINSNNNNNNYNNNKSKFNNNNNN